MYHSVFSNMSMIMMCSFTVWTKPMYLDGSIDTTLRLGTSTPGASLGKISQLDTINSLELTLAQTSAKNKLSSNLGTKRIHLFKDSSQQKQLVRITPHHSTCLQYKDTKPTKHVSLALQHHQSKNPYTHLTFCPYPSSMSKHNLQFLSSRHSHNQSGLTSLQGSSTIPQSLYQLFEMQDQTNLHHLPSVSHLKDTTRAQEKIGISRTHHSQKETFIPFDRQHEDSNGHDGHESHESILFHIDTYELAQYGKMALWGCDIVREEITSWFQEIKAMLTEDIDSQKYYGSKTDLRRALDRAHWKLTATFLGFLVKNHNHSGGTSKEEALSNGWRYLRNYMTHWKDVDLEVVFNLKGMKADDQVKDWTPQEVLAYSMWMNRRIHFPPKLLSKFVSGYESSSKL
ncbi:hypothetical protein DFH28DRAFT_944150 [Melampsora americana]|nr:hypothetical protein DFH28DRAFT_944150 [Melampsora americana]